MNTSSKTPDPLVFHNHHPIEAKKSPRTHHQNHFSVLARTLTGSDNNDNVSHNNSFHLKQYLSESVLVRNSLDCSQILKHNVYGDNKTQPSSLANTFDLYTTTNYYDNIYRKAEDLYTSKDNYLTPTTPTRMSVTPDLLFRSPRNTLKHRFNVCNGSNNNSNNQSSSSASVSPINVSAITNMNKVTSLYHKTDSNCKQDFAKTLPSVNSDPYVLDHQNHHASNGSPTERKHGGLIQNRCYNEHSSQLSYTPTPKEDTSYVMNSFSRKRPSYMMDATLLKSNTTNRLSQVQDKNRHYQQPSSIINQKITVPDAATTTSTVVNQHFNNALVQTEVKNERKRILANSSPITIDSALFNKLSVDQSKASYLEPSNNTLPISLSPSSILSNQVNVSGAHVIMMLSPSTTVPTSLHLSNTDEITSSDIKRMSNNSTGLQYSLTSSHIENFNSFGANLNSSKSSFPLLLVSASSSASAAALAEAAARATGAPPTSLVPVPVQVTTYIPASQTEDNNGQLNIQGENSNSQNANSNTSNQHFILSVMMNDSDEKSSSIPLGIRKIPLVLSAPIHPPNSNTTPSNIIHIDNKQHLSSTTASKYIPLINSSSGGKLTHQTA
ncbi:unnamed protein product [Heterobilharzia americana]|nr:unnamed protein product [Heterobilharzia americana]